MLLRHTSDINIPGDRNFPSVKDVAKQSEFQLFPQTRSNVGDNVLSQQQQNVVNASPTVDFIC